MRTRSLPVVGLLAMASLGSLPVLLGHPPHAARPDAAPPRLSSLAETASVHAFRRGHFLSELERSAFLEALAARDAARRSGCPAGDWQCFRACTQQVESGGNYAAVSSDGTYRGAYQYSQEFWDGQATEAGRPDLVGTDPAQASPADQDAIAQHTYSTRGNDPWLGRC